MGVGKHETVCLIVLAEAASCMDDDAGSCHQLHTDTTHAMMAPSQMLKCVTCIVM
jgi:hypothetical protein